MAEVVQQSPFMSGPMAGTMVNHIFDDNGRPNEPWSWTFKGMQDTSGNTITNQQWESQNAYISRSQPQITQNAPEIYNSSVESVLKPVRPTPATPSTISSNLVNINTSKATKTAPIDTILFDEDNVPIEVMTDLIFENIGGQELINVARTDTVNGQQIAYQPIKNLSILQQQFNPFNLISLQYTLNKYFANFSIKLENRIPNIGNGPNGGYVYIDPTNGNLTIEAINLRSDEQIEIQILTSGTIDEVEL